MYMKDIEKDKLIINVKDNNIYLGLECEIVKFLIERLVLKNE